MGLVIGTQAANIHAVKEKTGVDRIVVEPELGMVRIKGSTRESVLKAREELEYVVSAPVARASPSLSSAHLTLSRLPRRLPRWT